MAGQIIHSIFYLYTALLMIRVIGSWFPNLSQYGWMIFIAKLTDPYLNLFRRFIPPIGGVLDLSPLIGFFVLQFLETILLRIIR
jgi:YggT family protein